MPSPWTPRGTCTRAISWANGRRSSCAMNHENAEPPRLVPTLRVGTQARTLCVPNGRLAGPLTPARGRDAERRDVRSHAERGNEDFFQCRLADAAAACLVGPSGVA